MIKLTPGQFVWQICGCCEGSGKLDNPVFSNGFTSEEWNEMDFDDRESYLSGACDVLCDECEGSGKVREPIMSALTFSQKRELVRERRQARYDAESAAERRAEMRHCGYEC